jgi:hypothetical protein
MIKELERQAAAIPEVKKVENLLHLPKTPAPTRPDAPGRQRRTAAGEDLPVEAAREREGRQPAPLGANGAGS